MKAFALIRRDRDLFGVLVGYEAVMLPMTLMRSGTPGTERIILGIQALAMSYVFLRALRLIGNARVPQEIAQFSKRGSDVQLAA